MRIYTEVIWQWDDTQGKLVETSSKSEEYSGRVDLCKNAWYFMGYDKDGNRWDVSGDYRYRRYRDVTIWKTPFDSETGKHGAQESAGRFGGISDSYAKIGSMQNAANTVFASEMGDRYNTFEEVPKGEGAAISLDEFGTGADAMIQESAMDALKGYTGEWGRIVSGDSEYERTIQASLDTLARAGEEGAGETYLDPITQTEIPITGAVGAALADYETSTQRAGEDLAVAEEGVARGRETGLRAARGAYSPAIRQAEAAAAATGFAGTGAGDAARAELAEEFTAEVGDVETEAGVALSAAQLEQVRTTQDAATAFGGAQATFAQTKATHEQTVTNQQKAAQDALRQLQIDMAGTIQETRSLMDDDAWNPFTDNMSSLKGEGGTYGWQNPGFDPAAAEIYDNPSGVEAPVATSAPVATEEDASGSSLGAQILSEIGSYLSNL